MNLSGKTVLVTGASKGIGAAIARAVGQQGAHVIAHYGSDRDGAQEALKDLNEQRKHFVQADLTIPGSSLALWDQAIAWRGRVDVVVLNAAVNIETPFDGPLDEWDQGWQTSLQVNVLEPSLLIKCALAHYLDSGGGSFIGLSSWSAQRGSAISSLPAYAASKAAIKAVLQTVARNYASQGIYSYIISPGIVHTRMADLAAALRGGIEGVKAGLEMKEMVPPEEIGELVAWLCEGKVRHLTGSTIDVNGASYIR